MGNSSWRCRGAAVTMRGLLMMTLIGCSAANERWRPRFHYLPPEISGGGWQQNWINDPNGPFVDPLTRLYHLFGQYGNAALDGSPRWIHAVSSDAVQWRTLGVALMPAHDYDCGGIF